MILYIMLLSLGIVCGYALAVALFSAKVSGFEARHFFVLRELLRVIDSADSALCSDNGPSRESLKSLKENVEAVYNEIKELD